MGTYSSAHPAFFISILTGITCEGNTGTLEQSEDRGSRLTDSLVLRQYFWWGPDSIFGEGQTILSQHQVEMKDHDILQADYLPVKEVSGSPACLYYLKFLSFSLKLWTTRGVILLPQWKIMAHNSGYWLGFLASSPCCSRAEEPELKFC